MRTAGRLHNKFTVLKVLQSSIRQLFVNDRINGCDIGRFGKLVNGLFVVGCGDVVGGELVWRMIP